MQNKTILSIAGSLRCVLLFAISMLVIPGLLQAAGQRQNPWSYPGTSQEPAGNRPWANIPTGQDYRQYNQQYNGWREPPVTQQYNRPAYPYQGYTGTPYEGYTGSPYQGYTGSPYQGYTGSPYQGYTGSPYQGYTGSPYQGYTGSPYTDAYSGYGSPYNPSLLPGYGGMHGIYPGLEGGSIAPGTMFPYSGW
jgi:hypothetical protein